MTIRTDVLVVGTGPTGLILSSVLARNGIDALTINRYPGTAHSPRAHITNQRAMEVFRDLGANQDVLDHAVPAHGMHNCVWATSFAGQELARTPAWGNGAHFATEYALASPEQMCNIPQHVLEPVLLENARSHGAQILFSTELIDIEQDDHAVRATIRNRETGEETDVVASYVVGADGARSEVARGLGFEFTGESGLGAAMNVWLEADLTKYCEQRPGVLYWMTRPGNDFWVGSGTWIAVKPYTEWVLLFMYDPDTDGEPDTSEEALIARAQQTIQDPEVEVRIKAASKWQINHMAADHLQVGRVFIGGDAAHRHPPANGLGTNTSVQDAFNLGWKLAMVLKGQAGPKLLETYSAERQPVARTVVDRAMKSVGDMVPISQALGFAPGQSAEEGWASLDVLTHNSPEGEARRAALQDAITLQDYQFNCHGVEMDQWYHSTAVIEDTTEPLVHPEPNPDPELFYRASTDPGRNLPHAWLSSHGKTVSTKDVVGVDRFTLITGMDDAPWRDAVETLNRELGLDVRVSQICSFGEHDDVYGTWSRVRGITDAGAILVRPDHYIAWRHPDAAADPTATLRDVLDSVLDLAGAAGSTPPGTERSAEPSAPTTSLKGTS